MTLETDMQRKGGHERDKDRPEWEKQFMGVLAGSAGLLKKDNPAASNAKEAVTILKTLAARFPWQHIFLVGRDGNTVSSTLPDATAIARVNQMGGTIGLAGFIFLRGRFTPYARPLIAGNDVEPRLKAVVQKRWEEAQALIRDNKDAIEEASSPASASVYTDGKNSSVFYSWQPQQKPPKGWELAGKLYSVPATTGSGWVAKARLTELKWQPVMEQAMRHFEAKVRELIAPLNKGGLGLQDLKAFIALANKPELLKELKTKLER